MMDCAYCGAPILSDEQVCREQGPDPDPNFALVCSPGSDALGPCGCIDYHMADCPTVTDRFATANDFMYEDED